MIESGRPPQLLGHIEDARCISSEDGRWYLQLRGWFVHERSGFVTLKAGIGDEPLITLSAIPRTDVERAFPNLSPGSHPGFVGNIPLSTPHTGPIRITFFGSLAHGGITAFTLEASVTLAEGRNTETAQTIEYSPLRNSGISANIRILFLTDSLSSQTRRAQLHSATLQQLTAAGYSVTVIETDKIAFTETVEGHSTVEPYEIRRLAPDQNCDIASLLQRELPHHGILWVTQPGGLRLLLASSPDVRSTIIFDSSARLLQDLFASSPDVVVERHSFTGESFSVAQQMITLPEQIGAVYPASWFVELSNLADVLVVEDAHTAAELHKLGVASIMTRDNHLAEIVRKASAQAGRRPIMELPSSLPLLPATPSARRWSALPSIPDPRPVSSHTADAVIDIVIPIHNAAFELDNCIDALVRNTDLPSHLILVEDCSMDPRVDTILASVSARLRGSSFRAVTIVRLQRNAGFSGAVNLGIAAGTGAHVVLLNSDTVPPPQWLSRLVAPLTSDITIGSVTPLSNSATICSFRPTATTKQLFDIDALLKIDTLFARYGGNEPITIPTGVGFCLATHRRVLECIGFLDADLFRKMYAEENDWCMRVIRAGLRNVVITNLFVPHVDGASARDSNVNRYEILERNLAKLRALHPGYDASVRHFISNDPLQPLRTFMQLVLKLQDSTTSATLYVHNPELEGGSQRYLKQVLEHRSHRGPTLILAASSKETFLQRSLDDEGARVSLTDYLQDDALFRDLLSALNVEQIVVNQLVGTASGVIMERIRRSGRPYTVYLHDFYFACPTITLIGHTGRYCGAETRASHCSTCLRSYFESSPVASSLSITAWREHSYEFLLGASAIVAVSEHTKNLYLRYFPWLPIEVQEPVIELSRSHRALHNSTISLPILNVAVLGAIGKHKGSDIIYEMVETLRNRALPIKIIVCGYTDRHSGPYVDRGGFFEVTGPYDPLELPELLARHRIALTLLPSIWPETFLFTASESMGYGYPVMVSGLTAAAERVVEWDAGWVIEDLSAQGIIAQLERLFYNPHEIAQKTANLLSDAFVTDPNAPAVLAAHHPFKDCLVEL